MLTFSRRKLIIASVLLLVLGAIFFFHESAKSLPLAAATKHVPLQVPPSATKPPITITTTPYQTVDRQHGRLILLFRDPEGKPVPGVHVELLTKNTHASFHAPASPMKTLDALLQGTQHASPVAQRNSPSHGAVLPDEQAFKRADQQGNITWVLTPGVYRWRRLSPWQLDLNPPPPATQSMKPFLAKDGSPGWSFAGPPAPEDISGAIQIKGGVTRTFKVTVYTSCAIIGRLPVRNRRELEAYRIVLTREELHRNPYGPGNDVIIQHHVADAHLDDTCAFRWKNLKPGTFNVVAFWELHENIYLTRRKIRLQHWADLGTLVPWSEGPDTPVSLILKDSSGPLNPAKIFKPLTTPLTARIRFFHSGQVGPEGSLMADFPLELGHSVTLMGIPPRGLTALRVVQDPDFPKGAPDMVRPGNGSGTTLQPGKSLTLAYTVDWRKVVTLHCVLPTPKVLWLNYALLIPSKQHRLQWKGTLPPGCWHHGAIEWDIKAKAGEYAILVWPGQGNSPMRKSMGYYPVNKFAWKPLRVTDQDERVLLRLQQGIQLEGTILRRNGLPFADQYVVFRYRGWKSWIYDTRTDSEGHFHLTGTMPDMTLEGQVLQGLISTASSSSGLVLTYIGHLR